MTEQTNERTKLAKQGEHGLSYSKMLASRTLSMLLNSQSARVLAKYRKEKLPCRHDAEVTLAA